MKEHEKLIVSVAGGMMLYLLVNSPSFRKATLKVMTEVLKQEAQKDAQVSKTYTKDAQVSKSSEDGGLIKCTDDNLRR